ncbi:hypothetical protein OG946_13975 [Streptomyces sp. NBC_01808]|uniref:hypothetical protein n=1 Tax=Streptomyces sp. NBC_01808 TaxID=2975947 RepID=UPI002DD7B2BB|nr:hypothetical protein [Streptomyces sp. NBC_01808]WSA38386.1 hypothetical protein OG946_13975 [Streptomyces sp. NBC_01808]
MTESPTAGVEALLGEEILPLAASTFVGTFTGVGLGRERARNVVDKEIHHRFGKPRGGDAHYAYKAVILQIVLIWEQARIAARTASGPLVLLPDGARLLNATDAVDELRALLRA